MKESDRPICGYMKNGVSIMVVHMPHRKKPCLAIQFEGENEMYKVASFNSKKTAHWFLEIFEEFMGV